LAQKEPGAIEGKNEESNLDAITNSTPVLCRGTTVLETLEEKEKKWKRESILMYSQGVKRSYKRDTTATSELREIDSQWSVAMERSLKKKLSRKNINTQTN